MSPKRFPFAEYVGLCLNDFSSPAECDKTAVTLG